MRQRYPSASKRLPAIIFLCLLTIGNVWAQPDQVDPNARASSTGAQEESFNRFLDAERPNPAQLTTLKELASREPDAGLKPVQLARFHFQRAMSRRQLGRIQEAIEDIEKAVQLSKNTDLNPFEVKLAWVNLISEKGGEHFKAIRILQDMEREADRPGVKGWLFAIRRNTVRLALATGNFTMADDALARSKRLINEARGWPVFAEFGPRWLANIEAMTAEISLANQSFEQAIDSAQRAEMQFRRVAAGRGAATSDLDRRNFLAAADQMLVVQARAKIGLGRLAEADIDIRSVLTNTIRASGKFQLIVADELAVYRTVRFNQGRYEEADAINQRIFEILHALSIPTTSLRYVRNLNIQAQILSRLNRVQDALEAYRRVDKETEGWSRPEQQRMRISTHRVILYTNLGRSREMLVPAEQALQNTIRFRGEDHLLTAVARGAYANTLIRTGEPQKGLAEFRKALPVLLANVAQERDDLDAGGTSGQDFFIRNIVLNFLYAVSAQPAATGSDLADAFRFAEAVRADSVQRALVAASTRNATNNPQLGPIVRREQDLEKNISRTLMALEAQFSLPPENRDTKAMEGLKTTLKTQRAERARIQADLARRFPAFSGLQGKQEVNIEGVKKVLKPGEIFVSMHSGFQNTFIFAFGKETPVIFHRTDIRDVELAALVRNVQITLDASGGSILDVPAFDVQAAARLYDLLLKPVEPVLKTGNRIIVVSNGVLSGLPLGLLAREAPKIDVNSGPLFLAYRDVPWLIRSHAVTMLPSVSSFLTLRHTPPSKVVRKPFIGFGDPVFSAKERPAAPVEQLRGKNNRSAIKVPAGGLAMRNLRNGKVAATGLSELQRLPDTADELRSIALALGADPYESVVLRERANETEVRKIRLADYRIVAFATHGLVPEELPALRSPALALSAPADGSNDDGLLTMDEILQLQLDADWVILSACNTGSAKEAGAEAASGLGRAFFFAGSRALLVTAWAVHSASAGELVSGIFRNQQKDSGMDRAQALRRAMIDLMDKRGMKDEQGNLSVSYAHPVFWAPYMLIGDGGSVK